MYGEWLRKKVENRRKLTVFYAPNLTILLWQARNRSVTLMGLDANKCIPLIPFNGIKKAIQYSLLSLISYYHGDERNVLLTLARMWYTLANGQLNTKDVAAK